MLSAGRARLRLRGAAAADEERAARIDLVMQLVGRLVYDLGLLISGSSVALDAYVDRLAVERLNDAVAPALAADDGAIRPDFGEFAQVTIDGDILDATAAVRATVEFDDRSVRVNAAGAVVSRLRRRVRLMLLLEPALTSVNDVRVELV